MGTVVSVPKLSPVEKQLLTEGKLDRGSLYSRTSSKMRSLSREQQCAVFSSCRDLLDSRKENKAREKAEEEAALKVEWQDGEMLTVEEAEDIVHICWSRIGRQQHSGYMPRRNKTKQSVSTGGRVVRIFVSSTFADFFSEREILVKKVFPELKEWCESRNLQLIECDLRWGVPKDSTTEDTITTCLEEIDRCHDETDGEAFFLAMLGDRYGWIPTSREVPLDIIHQYEWVPNLSMTHMEILHGALRSHNPNAAFLLRDPGYISGLPTEHIKKFLDEDELPKAQLKELKRHIRELFADQVYNYQCHVEGVDDSTGEEKVKLSGLEDFCQQVLNFFKTAIDKKYPHSRDPLSPDQEENEQHRNYMNQKGSMVFGRERIIKTLLRFAKGDNSTIASEDTVSHSEDVTNHIVNVMMNGNSSESEDDSERDDIRVKVVIDSPPPENESDSLSKMNHDRPSSQSSQRLNKMVKFVKGHSSNSGLLVAIGNPGTGKSAVMAKTVLEAERAGLNVFYHFVGSCPSSIYEDNIIQRLCKYLLPRDDERLAKVKDEFSIEETTKLLHKVLKEKAEMSEQILIIIDAVNQLSDVDSSLHLEWLPARISELELDPSSSVRFIISTVEQTRSLSVLQDLSPPPHELPINQLNTSTRIDIVQHYLGRYNKRLDPYQLADLTKSDGAKNALWLTLSCEELRVFGVFERLSARIKTLPDNLDGLLAEILDRLVREDDTQSIEKTLCLLYCSQTGLPETDIQQLLGDPETQTPLPMLTWAQVRRTLKPFLRNIGVHGGIQRWDFFHQAIAKAVESKWVTDEEGKKKFHLNLADFYQYHSDDMNAVVRELPYQLQQAKSIQRFLDFLRKDERSLKINVGDKSRYMRQYRCQRVIMNPKAGFGRKLMMCHFCQMGRGAFTTVPMQNKDCCVLCGSFVHFKKDDNIAYLCQFHMPRAPPSCENCYICHKIFPSGPQGPVPGYVCLWCKFGNNPSCVKVLTENDKY
ncbi:TPR repeat-containing protein DDB_G0287407-like [Glandiceps talaboti]